MNGKIKALWIIGTNPLVSFPNREVLEHAFRRLDLLVVQDGFETPTTAIADVVLPAAIWGEKEGTFTNSERRVSRVRAAVRAARRGPPRLRHLPRRSPSTSACRDRLFPGWSGPVDAFEEWRRVSAGRLCDYSGITYDRIDAAGGVQWPCPADDPTVPLGGSPRLYADGAFPNPTGKVRLPPRRPAGAARSARGRSSRCCSTPAARSSTGTPAPRPAACRSSSASRPRPGWRSTRSTPPRSGVRSGDHVRVASSARARSTASSPGSPPSSGRARCSSRSTTTRRCANRLTLDEFDPISREPNYKQCAVRVERINA